MSSGGGKSSTPRLVNDNLQSKQFYRVLDIISEGPIYGPIDQTHLSSFLLNDTPVTDNDGNISINGVSCAWRPGSANQSPINGFDAIEATTIVNTEVKYDTPLVRTVTDIDVDRIRLNVGVTGLVQNDTKGNQSNTSVTMVIETRTGASSFTIQKTVTINGKISGEYLEAHVIEAPTTKPFDIRVRRITEDSTSDLLSNGTIWNSYTEISDYNLSYPYSAIVGSVIDRSQYTDTPSRTYYMRGIIVDVPDNYDSINRTYSGLWTGGFKSAWTNNPAWLLRALVKNNRYGLAKRAGNIDIDDGWLYTLSQFSDQLVNDGYGGQEPRCTLNAYITEQSSARDILDSIASMFRGMIVWDGIRLSIILDVPQDPVSSITNANVVDGKFTYSSMARSERYNAVVVSWTDPDNGWEQSKEYVSDDELIELYGYNETTLEAFGCTSRGQAYRAGKWLIEGCKREYKKISFSMARDAIAFMPGDIVEIMDNRRVQARLGGRIKSHSGAVITVDAEVSELANNGDSISILGSTGKFVSYEIQSVSGADITLQTAPMWVKDGTVFTISTSEINIRLWRIMSISEDENNSNYTISAVLHDPNKQAVVDEGAVFEVQSDTLNGYRVPNIENLKIANTNSETVQVTATWSTATTTRKLMFELYIYNESGAVVAQYETDQFKYEFYGLNAGTYILGVRGRNDNGMKGSETQVSLIIGAPKAPSYVQWVEGIMQATLVPVMSVSATSDTTFEFWWSGEEQITDVSLIESQAQFLGRGSQWVVSNLGIGLTYYAYIRTRNAFGYSDFVAVSGSPDDDVGGLIDVIEEQIKQTEGYKQLVGLSESSAQAAIENAKAAIENALANDKDVQRQYKENGSMKASITETRAIVLTEKEAIAIFMQEINSTVENISSAVTTLNETIASNEEATALALQSLNTKVGDVETNMSSTMQIVSDIDGNLSAYNTFRIEVDDNGTKYVTGMTQGIENTSEGYQSNTVFLQDRFTIMNAAGGTPQTIFTTQGNQVIIDSTVIGDATINYAKISDTLKSTNFVSDSSGWQILKNGAAEFNDVTVRGTVYASNGSFSGEIKASSGYLDNVTINENCIIKGTLRAEKIEGDVGRSIWLPNNGSNITIAAEPFTRNLSSGQLIVVSEGEGVANYAIYVNNTSVFSLVASSTSDKTTFVTKSFLRTIAAGQSISIRAVASYSPGSSGAAIGPQGITLNLMKS